MEKEKLLKNENINTANNNFLSYMKNFKSTIISSTTSPSSKEKNIEFDEKFAFQTLKPINIYNEIEKIQELVKNYDKQIEEMKKIQGVNHYGEVLPSSEVAKDNANIQEIKNIQRKYKFNDRRKEKKKKKKNKTNEEFYPFDDESYCLIF